MRKAWIGAVALGVVAVLWLAQCRPGESRISEKPTAELIASLGSDLWMTRDSAGQELIRRGLEEAGPAVLQAWDEASDPAMRGLLGEVLHAWGILPVSRPQRARWMAALVAFSGLLEEHIQSIPSKPEGWSENVVRDLNVGFGRMLAPIQYEQHVRVREFRDQMFREAHYALAAVRQGETAPALAALESLRETLEKRIHLQGALEPEPPPAAELDS